MRTIKLDIASQPVSPFDEPTVVMLAQSMARNGLLQPVVVQRAANGAERPFRLIAGRNRMEAARRLGWVEIDALVMLAVEGEGAEVSGELAEIAENLHRREIGVAERDALIRRYAGIVEKREALQSRHAVANESKREDRRGHRPEGIPAKVAADLGIGKRTVQRALSTKPAIVKSPLNTIDVNRQFQQFNEEVDALRSAWSIFYSALLKSEPRVRRHLLAILTGEWKNYGRSYIRPDAKPKHEGFAFEGAIKAPGYDEAMEIYALLKSRKADRKAASKNKAPRSCDDDNYPQ